MKLRLEATPDELGEKSEELLARLADASPEIAALLEKALPPKERELKYQVLRDLEAKTSKEYERTLKRMVTAIGKVLDRGPVSKSEDIGLVYVNDPEDLSKGWFCGVCGAVSPGERCEHIHEAQANMAKALYIGPRGGRWADPKLTIPYDAKKHGPAQIGFAFGPKPEKRAKHKPDKPEEPRVSDVIKNDPVLTDKQRAKPKSAALKNIDKRIDAGVAKDPGEWELPAGARIDDPWKAPESDPDESWSHPDYGKGKGAAPWHKSEDWKPDFHEYDVVLVNSSAGKDSQAMLTAIVEHADKVGFPRDKIIVVHADLGRVEWEGSKTLAQQQAEQYGLRFEVVKREKNDLVEQIDERHGDLSQREIDSALILEAGIRTWQELADAPEKRLLSLIGDGAGVSAHPGEVRATKLIAAAKQKIKRERKKHAKKIAKAEAALDKAKGKLTLADTDPKRQRAEKVVAQVQAKLDALHDLGDPQTWPIDFGKAIPWPSMDSRFCTSDHKRDVIKKLMTKLGEEFREGGKKGPVKILNSLGIRAQESTGRAKMDNFTRESETGTKIVDRWYPIHRWHEKKVWETIAASGVPFHRAYRLGMRRLSCCFCIFAPKEDLMIAAIHNPNLFKTYLELEEKVGVPFTEKMSLADIAKEIENRRSKGYELNDLAEWVKKALGLEDLDDDLVKAELARGDVEPTLIGLLLEAGLARLNRLGQSIQMVTIEWKTTGACFHLDTAVDSHHVEHLPYPQAYNASMVAATFAQRHGLAFEEHNVPGPLEDGELTKAEDDLDGWIELPEAAGEALWGTLEKSGARPHKYIRRVPYTGPDGKRRYRYYYQESAAARAAKVGEEVRLGERMVRVTEVREDGDITIEEVSGPEGRKIHVSERISANAWAETLAEHYGEKFYQAAEKRARQAINAVLRHVPARMLADLRGKTDKERLEDLKKRVPEVYERLQAAFQRAGMDPFQAKTVLGNALERKGWEPEARALVIGAVLTPEGAKLAKRHRQLMDAAENLAGGDLVEPKHAAVAIDLVTSNVSETAQRAERELSKLQKTLQDAWERPGDLEKKAAVLAQAMASRAVQKLQALATAFPGLADKAVSVARDTMLEVASVAPAPPKQEGAEASVFVAGPGGQPKALKAKYKLVEAADLIPSHNPVSFRPNRGYPEKVQERAYHRDQAEQIKVTNNAKTMKPAFVVNTSPDAVNGPPLVTDDGIVLGGNSRTMSMQRVYAEANLADKADELKAYLEAHAHEVGLNADDVMAMKQPILVRVVEVEDRSTENLQLLVRQMNESFMQAMDPRTFQVAMGRRLTDRALAALADGMQGDETLRQFLDTARSRPFVQALYDAGIIDARNMNQYTMKGTKSQLNPDGKQFVDRILVGSMLADADLLSDTSPQLITTLAQSVPYMIKAKGSGEGYDLGADVQLAMDAFNRLQSMVRQGTIDPLDPKRPEEQLQKDFENHLADMFLGRHPVLDNSKARTLLELFVRRGDKPVQMAAVFKEFVRLAGENPENQRQLLGESLTPEQVFRHSVKAALDKEAKAEAVAAAEVQEKQRKKQAGATEQGLFAQSRADDDDLEKALFIGPKGGRWADAAHTISYDEKKHGKAAKQKPPAKSDVPWNTELAKRPLYHGGKKKITKIDPAKLQTRDPGFYGEGFYVTGNKKYAKTYGGRITTVHLDPDAKVLGPYGLNAKTINRELQAKVKEWLMGEPYERAKARGKGGSFLEFVEMINPDSPEFSNLEWKTQAWRYSEAMGADVHVATEGEIVIRNLDVATTGEKKKAEPKGGDQLRDAFLAAKTPEEKVDTAEAWYNGDRDHWRDHNPGSYTPKWAAIREALPADHEDHQEVVDWIESKHAHVKKIMSGGFQKEYKARKKKEAKEAEYEAQGVELEGPTPLSKLKGKQVWLYHGTSSKLLKKIKDAGLTPAAVHGKQSNVGATSMTEATPDFVYLTSETTGPGSAEWYASQAAAKHGGDPVMIRVLVDGDDLERDPDDEDIKSGATQFVVDSVTPGQLMEVDGKKLKKADPAEPLVNDFTKPVHDRDERAYNRVKGVLIGRGFLETDFDEDGPFWGWSVNQLIDFARKRAN